MGELIPAGWDLDDLARKINDEHQAVGAALRSGLEHARACGELLLEAKGKVAHGGWLPWLREHCEVSERTAQAYMRVAQHWPELEAKAQHVADLTFRDGLALLASAPPAEAELAAQESIHDKAQAATREALVACREILDNPAATIEELLVVRQGCEDLQQGWAEVNLRIQRQLGRLLFKGAPSLPQSDVAGSPGSGKPCSDKPAAEAVPGLTVELEEGILVLRLPRGDAGARLTAVGPELFGEPTAQEFAALSLGMAELMWQAFRAGGATEPPQGHKARQEWLAERGEELEALKAFQQWAQRFAVVTAKGE